MDSLFPNIKVERTRYKLSQNHQKLLSAVAAGTPPDLVGNHYYYFPHSQKFMRGGSSVWRRCASYVANVSS